MSKIDAQSYENFVHSKNLDKFELDMEKGDCKKWLDMYPSHKYGILAGLIKMNNDISRKTLESFISLGIDINIPIPQLQTTLMRYACSHRRCAMLEMLIKAGGKIENGCLTYLFEGSAGYSDQSANAFIVLKMAKVLNISNLKDVFPHHFISDFYFKNDEILKMMCESEGIDYQKAQQKFESSTIDILLNSAIADKDFNSFIFVLQKIESLPESIVSAVACMDDSRFLRASILVGGDPSEFDGVPLWNSVICGKKSNYNILKHTLPYLVFENDEQETRFRDAVLMFA